MSNIYEINSFIGYYKKAFIAVVFVFFLPVLVFFSAVQYLFKAFGVEHLTVEAILPLLPFLAFSFVIIFLFNGAFWIGFFSEDPIRLKKEHNKAH